MGEIRRKEGKDNSHQRASFVSDLGGKRIPDVKLPVRQRAEDERQEPTILSDPGFRHSKIRWLKDTFY